MTNAHCQAGKVKEELPYRLTLPQLLLGAVEVEVHVETLHELRDRVLVRVRLLQAHRAVLVKSFSHVRGRIVLLTIADLTC